jgi:hypothetical protein
MSSTHGEATDKPTGPYAGRGTGNGSGAEHRDYQAKSVHTATAGGPRAGTAAHDTTGSGPSIGALISSLLSDTTRLLRDEVRLAKAELGSKVSQARHGAVNTIIGGGILLLGVIFIMLAAVYALALVLPPWAASLIVGGIVAAIGVIMLKKGTDELKAKNLAPHRTQENVQRDAAMIRETR